MNAATIKRIDRLYRLLDMVGKSGYVDTRPIIKEILELHEHGTALR
jgi:hypothetical protein